MFVLYKQLPRYDVHINTMRIVIPVIRYNLFPGTFLLLIIRGLQLKIFSIFGYYFISISMPFSMSMPKSMSLSMSGLIYDWNMNTYSETCHGINEVLHTGDKTNVIPMLWPFSDLWEGIQYTLMKWIENQRLSVFSGYGFLMIRLVWPLGFYGRASLGQWPFLEEKPTNGYLISGIIAKIYTLWPLQSCQKNIFYA